MKHLEEITSLGDECSKCFPDIFNDFGDHTPLKLCALKYYTEIYTMILKPDLLRKLGFNGKAFIDVFAGAGVSKITKDNIKVAGSFPIALNYHYKDQPFDHYYGIEIDHAKCEALTQRSRRYANEADLTLINGDSNEEIFKIMDEIDEKKYHYLAFVDYESLKGLSWKGMKRILDSNGDLLITLINPHRTAGLAKKNTSAFNTMCNLYSEEVVHKSTINDSIVPNVLYDEYFNLLRVYRKNLLDIKITGSRGYNYTLLFATRETNSGSKYVRSMESLKSRIEEIDGLWVDSALSILKRGQQTLD